MGHSVPYLPIFLGWSTSPSSSAPQRGSPCAARNDWLAVSKKRSKNSKNATNLTNVQIIEKILFVATLALNSFHQLRPVESRLVSSHRENLDSYASIFCTDGRIARLDSKCESPIHVGIITVLGYQHAVVSHFLLLVPNSRL